VRREHSGIDPNQSRREALLCASRIQLLATQLGTAASHPKGNPGLVLPRFWVIAEAQRARGDACVTFVTRESDDDYNQRTHESIKHGDPA
jgi:hypothetical protein